jgi:hypothetical protein
LSALKLQKDCTDFFGEVRFMFAQHTGAVFSALKY